MSDYKVVFRADAENAENGITWEPGCPLMLEAIQVSRNTETGEAFLQAKVRNLTDKTIESFKMKLSCTYQDGSSETFEAESLDADIAPCGEYVPKAVRLAKGSAAKAGGHVTMAKESETVWRSSASPEPLPQRKPLNLSEMALAERMLQLRERGCSKAQEAAPYGQAEHDGWTQCACGQISMGLGVCPSCGLDMENVSELENEDYLEGVADRRAERERKRMEVQAELITKRKAAARKCALGAGAFLAVALVVFGMVGIAQSVESSTLSVAKIEPYLARAGERLFDQALSEIDSMQPQQPPMPTELMDEDMEALLVYLDLTFDETGFSETDAWNSAGTSFKVGEGIFLGDECTVRIWFSSHGVLFGNEKPTHIEVGWPTGYTLKYMEAVITELLGCDATESSKTSFTVPIPDSDLVIVAYDLGTHESLDIKKRE